MKTNGHKTNETGSIASKAELVAYEADCGNKKDPRPRPPRPPSPRREKRLLG